ncbi:DUF4956 domain-containing protein [Schaalia sp. 19OD2882]|uniref:DUF4956 domain-containing protein n=1 Tax=Schaalia sp. 19OD2882 TaxID=2794089 RepID=UPI001C1F1144|nr:DUF4956 domain-containing protein [Schaalia sp. 19OD2882]QWW19520.1 DUF4956 domain-containing protein [Schaalia sp. 19OD2882]
MTTAAALMILVDLVAMAILVLGLYYPRHRRADLVAAFLGVNIGVVAVAMVLAGTTVSAGLGLGLFGVLSIIRLRSDEITQREIAYYFASLSIGLITGMSTTVSPLVLGLVALVLTVIALADSPLLLGRTRSQQVQLDRAIADEDQLRAALAEHLGARITAVKVLKLDLVNDLTLVDVHFRSPSTRTLPAARHGDDQPISLDRAGRIRQEVA